MPPSWLAQQSHGQARWLPLERAELPAGLRIRPAARLADELHYAVGARPWDRDTRDGRLLAEIAAGRGRVVDSELQNPLGYPAPCEPTRRPFDPEAWLLDHMSPKSGWASLFNPLPGKFP